MKKTLILTLFILLSTMVRAQDEFNCFSILVGRNASVDGSVLFAHIEDDYGKQLVNWYAVSKEAYHEGSEFVLKNGGRINQPPFTNKYLWLEMPGMDFSDSYLNEYGVCIASNSCPSREDNPEITNGGIGYNLRQLMAERAVSARDAVVLAGQLIEKFGYTSSGRTYSIADQNEAWVLAVVAGKHWVAQRIPDDQVMVLPNNYTIREVDLSDQEHFLACPDLIEYAVKRGWYDPATDGPFRFRDCYAAKNSISNPGNVNRAWGAYYLLKTGFGLKDDFPFSFKPAEPLSKENLMVILRSHYEGTDLDKSEGYTKGSPYQVNGTMICGKASVYGFVAELRNWMPADLGCVIWLAPQWPDIQPFLPLYSGVASMPAGFNRPGYLNSIDNHYNPPSDIHERDDQHAFWKFVRFSELINSGYGKYINTVRKEVGKIEKKILSDQARLEIKLLQVHESSPEAARKALTSLYANYSRLALRMTEKLTKELN